MSGGLAVWILAAGFWVCATGWATERRARRRDLDRQRQSINARDRLAAQRADEDRQTITHLRAKLAEAERRALRGSGADESDVAALRAVR